MYEVGWAHAARLPVEVLLFRSDDAPILFDIANVRVNRYDPDGDPQAARSQVRDALAEALREVDTKRHFAVSRAADSLDYASWWLLVEAHAQNGVMHPQTRTMGQVLSSIDRRIAIARLLELGILRTEYLQMTPAKLGKDDGTPAEALLKYKCTIFGEAVFKETAARFGLSDPAVAEILERGLLDSGSK
jgi:hypothetical protein